MRLMGRLLPALALSAVAAGAAPLLSQASVAAGPKCAADSWTVDAAARFGKIVDFTVPVQVESPSGGINAWEILVSEGDAYFQWTDNAGSTVGILSSGVRVDDGKRHHFRADVAQTAGGISVTFTVDGKTFGPTTIGGKTLDASNSTVTINPLQADLQGDPAVVGPVKLHVAHCRA